MMVKKKKITMLRESIKPINSHKDRTRRFLGHFTKSKQQRIQSKKDSAKGGKPSG